MDRKITMKDVRKAGMCSRGARAFFKRHNLDYSDFLKNGIDVKKLNETGDAMAFDVIRIAHGR